MPQRLRRRQEALFAVREFIAKILERWSEAWREVLASALAAALSWFLAQRLFGHQQPIFAAITAIVCLAPGLPSHTKQTVGLLLGVATGILVGELSLVLLDDIPLLRGRGLSPISALSNIYRLRGWRLRGRPRQRVRNP
jgi:hypothetical protein